jgi:urease accessory protein
MASATRKNGSDSLHLLLQVSNSSFPTGAFSHSYGFETFLREGKIRTAADAQQWCERWLRYGVASGDGIAVVSAFRRALYQDMDGLDALSESVAALKLSRETREASQKTGLALLAACRDVFKLPEILKLEARIEAGKMQPHHAIVYGVAGAGLGFTEAQTIETYLWSSFSNIVSVIGRLMPLGQTDVQRIVLEASGLLEKSAEIARSRSEDQMCSMLAGLDAASMRHERLPSRLCIS